MKQHKSSAQLKALAKESLMGKYTVAVLSTLLYLIVTYFITEFSSVFLLIPGAVGTILYYASVLLVTVFTGIFAFGYNYIFMKIACDKDGRMAVKANDLFFGFSGRAKEILKAQFFRALISFVSFVPFYIFSSFVKMEELEKYIGLYAILFGLGLLGQFIVILLYNQTFFIMLDFPSYDAKKALAFSRELMKGNKGRYIYLLVSFIPIYLLGILSCFVGLLWVLPYIQATQAHFYLDLVQNKD